MIMIEQLNIARMSFGMGRDWWCILAVLIRSHLFYDTKNDQSGYPRQKLPIFGPCAIYH
jgi:hypothetical protein